MGLFDNWNQDWVKLECQGVPLIAGLHMYQVPVGHRAVHGPFSSWDCIISVESIFYIVRVGGCP